MRAAPYQILSASYIEGTVATVACTRLMQNWHSYTAMMKHSAGWLNQCRLVKSHHKNTGKMESGNHRSLYIDTFLSEVVHMKFSMLWDSYLFMISASWAAEPFWEAEQWWIHHLLALMNIRLWVELFKAFLSMLQVGWESNSSWSLHIKSTFKLYYEFGPLLPGKRQTCKVVS